MPVHGDRPGARVAAAFSVCVFDSPVWLGDFGWESAGSRCGEQNELSCDGDVHIERRGMEWFGYGVDG